MTLTEILSFGTFLVFVLGALMGGYFKISGVVKEKIEEFSKSYAKDMEMIKEKIDKVETENEKIRTNYNTKFDKVDRRFDSLHEIIMEMKDQAAHTREQMIQNFSDLKTLILEKRS